MEEQQIEFIIWPDGTVEEKVFGIQGPECEVVSRDIEDSLGKIADRKRTASYYAPSERQAGDSITTSS